MKRVLAPILLLLAGLACAGAVFAIQEIEDGSGPVGDPFLSPAFSPDGDGTSDEAVVSFRLARDARVRVSIVADVRAGEPTPEDALDVGDLPPLRTVATLLDAEVEAGAVRATWDGRDEAGKLVPERAYRAIIRLDDGPAYLPRGILRLDVSPPVACGEASLGGDGITGTMVVERGATVQVREAGDDLSRADDAARAVPVQAQRLVRHPSGLRRDGIRLELQGEVAERVPVLVVRDRAGNRSVLVPEGVDAEVPGSLPLVGACR